MCTINLFEELATLRKVLIDVEANLKLVRVVLLEFQQKRLGKYLDGLRELLRRY
jgi:hypothetical protein